jgi:hypothetical protein
LRQTHNENPESKTIFERQTSMIFLFYDMPLVQLSLTSEGTFFCYPYPFTFMIMCHCKDCGEKLNFESHDDASFWAHPNDEKINLAEKSWHEQDGRRSGGLSRRGSCVFTQLTSRRFWYGREMSAGSPRRPIWLVITLVVSRRVCGCLCLASGRAGWLEPRRRVCSVPVEVTFRWFWQDGEGCYSIALGHLRNIRMRDGQDWWRLLFPWPAFDSATRFFSFLREISVSLNYNASIQRWSSRCRSEEYFHGQPL